MFKINIRDHSYETNSSSSHSCTMSTDDIFDLSFDQASLRSGVLVLKDISDHFGDWYRLYKPENKLLYILASMDLPTLEFEDGVASDAVVDVMPQFVFASSDVATLIGFIESEYRVSVQLPVVRGKAHRFELSNWDSLEFSQLIRDPVGLKRLLFSSSSYIETNPENSYMEDGEQIDTDRGPEVY